MITCTYNACIGNPNTPFELPGLVLDKTYLGDSILLFQEGSTGARSPAQFDANLFKFNRRFQLKFIAHKNRTRRPQKLGLQKRRDNTKCENQGGVQLSSW